MAGLLGTLGLDKAKVESVEVASIREGFEVLKSGIYKGTLKTLGLFSTDTENVLQCKMVAEINVNGEEKPREISKYFNFRYNKKDSDEVVINDIGLKDLTGALNATGVELTDDTKTAIITEKCYATDRDLTSFVDALGKPVSFFVREVFEEGATYEKYNEIEGVFKPDGTNANGEDQSETFNTKIEKTPVLNRKPKAGATTNTSKEASEKASNAKRRI